MRKKLLRRILVLSGGAVVLFGVAVTASYVLARRTAAEFYRGSEVVFEPFHVSLSLSWWPAVKGAREFCEGKGIWEARACETGNLCCDFVGRICLSEVGNIVAMWPADFAERLAWVIEHAKRRAAAQLTP